LRGIASVNTAGGSLTRRPGELARAGVNDIFAELVASVITIAYGLSFAALIFAPPLNTWLAYGIAATFITSAVTAAIVAARSSLPFAIAGPDPTTVAVTATLVSALVARLTAQGLPDDLLAPVAIIMALSAALTGILLFALGLARCSTSAWSPALIPRRCTALPRSSEPPTSSAPGSCWSISRLSSASLSAIANSPPTT
jgi:hypothetical protein